MKKQLFNLSLILSIAFSSLSHSSIVNENEHIVGIYQGVNEANKPCSLEILSVEKILDTTFEYTDFPGDTTLYSNTKYVMKVKSKQFAEPESEIKAKSSFRSPEDAYAIEHIYAAKLDDQLSYILQIKLSVDKDSLNIVSVDNFNYTGSKKTFFRTKKYDSYCIDLIKVE